MPRQSPLRARALPALLLLAPLIALAGTPRITDAQAAAHVGQSVVVEGRVVAVYTSPSGNIYLNFGAVYPAQDFSVVIYSIDGGSFLNVAKYDHRRVAVSGTVELYRGKPEIVVHSPSQLRLLG